MNQEIASKLLALRKQNGFSQEELAEKLGVSRQAVSKWERGEASPDTENLILLAKIYGISLDRLFGLETEPVSKRSVINLEKAERDDSSAEADGNMRVMYPQGSADEEIYPSPGPEEQAENTSEKPYMEAEANYGTYFKYETVDDEESQKESARQRKVSENLNTLADRIRNDEKFYRKLIRFPYPVAAAALFLVSGALADLWHPMWMVFLTIPLYYTAIEAVKHRSANIFCYPVAVALLYLMSGFAVDFWHPGWLMFLTIPLYYWMINRDKADGAEQ